MAESTCTVDGCDSAAKRRGWCSRHYQSWYRYGDPLATTARQPTQCALCGSPVVRVTAHGPAPKYCSKQCQTRANHVSPAGVARQKRRQASQKKAPRLIQCASCDQGFEAVRSDARFCSPRCLQRATRDSATQVCATDGCDKPKRAKGLCNYCYRKARGETQQWTDARRDAYHRRRALKAETSSGRPVLLSEIRVRDGNRCHLCRKAVPDQVWPHPLSPSLDHVVPLSKGGAHDPDNVRLSHLRCNVQKGARGGNEQLLLIG